MPLPVDIEVLEPLTGAFRETHYRLPLRPTAAVKSISQALVGGAVALSLIPLVFSIFFALVVPRDDVKFYLIAVFMPLAFFGAFLFPAAAALLAIGVNLRWGRIEICCTAERIRVRSGWGLFRWTRRLPIDGLKGFRVHAGLLNMTSTAFANSPSPPTDATEFGVLFADYARGSSRLICAGYSRAWLTELASVLTNQCQAASPAGATLQPVTETHDRSIIVQRPKQPSNSNAHVELVGDTLTIELPPLGWRRAVPAPLMIFCLFWNGFLILWSLMFIPALFAGEVKWNDGPEKTSVWFGLLFSTPFYLVGLGMLAYWLGAARYSASLQINNAGLRLREQTLFGPRIQQWREGELQSIRVVSRKGNDEDHPWSLVLELTSLDGSVKTIFADREQAELEWLATTLRKALTISAPG